jgi:hypothetical protein
VTGLADVVRDFDEALRDIRRLAIEVMYRTAGGSSHLTGYELVETAGDVIASGRAVADAHRAAVRVFNETRRTAPPEFVVGDRDYLSQPPELDRLRIELKSWLFFVRAVCDNAYRLLTANETGEPAKRSGSMSSVVGDKNEQKPVARVLRAEAPGFLEWFESFRDMRDAVKRGVGCGFTALDSRGLSFTTYVLHASETEVLTLEIGRTMTFAEVAESAQRVAELLSLVVSPSGEPREPG